MDCDFSRTDPSGVYLTPVAQEELWAEVLSLGHVVWLPRVRRLVQVTEKASRAQGPGHPPQLRQQLCPPVVRLTCKHVVDTKTMVGTLAVLNQPICPQPLETFHLNSGWQGCFLSLTEHQAWDKTVRLQGLTQNLRPDLQLPSQPRLRVGRKTQISKREHVVAQEQTTWSAGTALVVSVCREFSGRWGSVEWQVLGGIRRPS